MIHKRLFAACLLAGCAVFAPGSAPQDRDFSPERLFQNLAAKRFSGKPITIRVTAEDLKSAIEEIQKFSGLPIDLDPAAAAYVRRKSSEGNLIIGNQMPWDALLDSILREFRLGIAMEDGRLLIRSPSGNLETIGKPEPAARSSAWIWIIAPAALLAAAAIFIIRGKAASSRSRAKFALDTGTAEEIKAKILYLLEVEKIYGDEELSLQSLSARLAIPVHHLSWVMNEVLGQSFSRLVNTYRIEAVKKRLRDPREAGRTILDIAFEAGFNTKTSFNKVFKQKTGMTPSEFREKIQP